MYDLGYERPWAYACECCMSRLSVFMSSLRIPACIRGKGLFPAMRWNVLVVIIWPAVLGAAAVVWWHEKSKAPEPILKLFRRQESSSRRAIPPALRRSRMARWTAFTLRINLNISELFSTSHACSLAASASGVICFGYGPGFSTIGRLTNCDPSGGIGVSVGSTTVAHSPASKRSKLSKGGGPTLRHQPKLFIDSSEITLFHRCSVSIQDDHWMFLFTTKIYQAESLGWKTQPSHVVRLLPSVQNLDWDLPKASRT